MQTGKGQHSFKHRRVIIFLTDANPNLQTAEEMKSG
jgi:hypothetical protein